MINYFKIFMNDDDNNYLIIYTFIIALKYLYFYNCQYNKIIFEIL